MALDDNSTDFNRLEELGGSDYEIADGQPNIKGWDVKTDSGQSVGDVDELLFNPQSRKVRYIVLDTDANDFSLEARKVLVPIGIAELHEDDDDVILPNVTAEQLSALPAYEEGTLNADTETNIRNIFAGLGTAGIAAGAYNASHGEDFYQHDQFNQDRLYNRRQPVTDTTTDTSAIPVIKEDLNVGKREVETGGARITSTIVETPVEETVNLREEHVNVNRTPVDRPASATDLDTFQEGEIELTEHTEVPVVSKEARVVEEVSLNREVTESEETIRDTVRHTEVETEKFNRTDDKKDNLL